MFCSSDWLSGWQGLPVRALLEVLLVVIGLWALGVGGAMLGDTLGGRAGFAPLEVSCCVRVTGILVGLVRVEVPCCVRVTGL